MSVSSSTRTRTSVETTPEPESRLGRMPGRPTSRLLGVLATLVAALTVLPVAVVLVRAASGPASEALDYLLRPRIGELLAHTGWLMLLTVPATVVLGVGAAWLVERTDGRRFVIAGSLLDPEQPLDELEATLLFGAVRDLVADL